ncbi:hypothetical protein [Cohnella sp. AR92]|uniref:hypothetical protein n=1 Tax=Cohnella sp. AR92 TaxID=648716 RepID=UPI000F8D234F|nr:hypothetical protein [Cohnella sp. AR92]RUS48891.1 hypothetical protein ELR57_00650 [Cohnella sp. AR92]
MKFINSTIAEVSTEALWQAWADVPSWPQWDREIVEAKLEGPFAVGVSGGMKSAKGGVWSKFRIVGIDKAKGYSCIVPLPGGRLTFNRSFEKLNTGALRITHELDFTGLLGWLYAFIIGRPTNKIYPEMLQTFVELVQERDRKDGLPS